MAEYKTPGVYIEEIPKLPPSIASVETAIPAFIGYTEKAKRKEDDDLHLKPLRISSLLEYEQYFGGAMGETGIEVTFASSTDTQPLAKLATPKKMLMYYSLQMFFANGGGPCYIVSTGSYTSSGGNVQFADLDKGLTEVAKVNEVTLIVFPDSLNIATSVDYYALHTKAIEQAVDLKDRFVVMDVWIDSDTTVNNIDVLRSAALPVEVEKLKYAAVYYPRIYTILDYFYKADTDVKVNGIGGVTELAGLKAANNALYFIAKNAITNIELLLPASCAVVGKYADVDETRGVWKAPANVNINYAIRPSVIISHKDQEGLNVDALAGKSINVIRSFPGRGPAIIWGARTLAGNDNEWRYVSVRRFFNMVEESTKNATEQFVFEPNDRNTWVRVKSMISNYLTQQWKAGALMGASTKEAFYVHVGLGETMTELDIWEGRMIVEIGLAVVRPAEFIILRFMHKMLSES